MKLCPVARNTNYYRRNKLERNIVHKCPYANCDYETTGPKQTLKNHINAKHIPESERPFQCKFAGCNRGYAQKCLLNNHYKKAHGLTLKLKKNRTIVEYHININNADYLPTTSSTINRFNYYKSNPIIKAENLGTFEFLPGKFLNANHIHYDAREGYIHLKTYNVDEMKKRKKIKKMPKKSKKFIKIKMSL